MPHDALPFFVLMPHLHLGSRGEGVMIVASASVSTELRSPIFTVPAQLAGLDPLQEKGAGNVIPGLGRVLGLGTNMAAQFNIADQHWRAGSE
jgi:hypothetical protein